MKILTYFFLQMFIIFDGLSDLSKKWETIFSVEFPFNGGRVTLKIIFQIACRVKGGA